MRQTKSNLYRLKTKVRFFGHRYTAFRGKKIDITAMMEKLGNIRVLNCVK